jgi:hypothetical protein
MKNGLLIIIFTILLVSCKKNDSNDDADLLKDQYHGKYEILSSFSEAPLDLNMDGISSNDLLSENAEISRSGLEIRIQSENSQLFDEKWPVESIVIPRGEKFDSTSYHSTYEVYYALYFNGLSCTINAKNRSIQLKDSPRQDQTNTLIEIESVSIELDNIIKVTALRKVYTKKGWVKTKIVSTYKRYTQIT